MSAKVWYYSNDGDKSGPFTLEAIVEFIETRLIVSETLVWKDGLEDWIPAHACEDLSPHFNYVHSPPPLPRDSENHESDESSPPLSKANKKGFGISAQIMAASLLTSLIYSLGDNDAGDGFGFFGYVIGGSISVLAFTYLFAWIPGGLYWIIKRQKMPGFNYCLWVVWGIWSLFVLIGQ